VDFKDAGGESVNGIKQVDNVVSGWAVLNTLMNSVFRSS
jgi:hypothetical protein